MPETCLSHFDHHWEAELARGYLEDAGVPSHLASDNLAGGYAYMGSVSGASLFVAPERLEEARGILVAAGVLRAGAGAVESTLGPAPRRDGAPPLPSPPSTVREADRADLTERLGAARKAEVRHFIRCMLGVTPTAVIPAVGLALEGNVAVLALLCVLVSLFEGWRWMRAGREVKRAQEALATLDARAGEAGEGTGA